MNPDRFHPMTPQLSPSHQASSPAFPSSASSESEAREQAASERDTVKMEEVDPTGLMRALGEFFQTFAAPPQSDASR